MKDKKGVTLIALVITIIVIYNYKFSRWCNNSLQ